MAHKPTKKRRVKQVYTVGLTRLAVVYTSVDVVAASAEAAGKNALHIAKDGVLWEVDALYDDDKPHCEISVSSVIDTEGVEHAVGDISCPP